MKPVAIVLVLASLVPFTTRAEEPPKTTAAEEPKDVAELKKVVDALKNLHISGYLQAQYVNDERSKDELSGSSSKNLDQFSVRRARIKFTYQATPAARLVIQPDFGSSGVTLKDGFLELREPWTSWKHTLTAGQFGQPFGFELPYSSSQREVAERSRMIRALFGDRDRGLMLSGRGLGEHLSYAVAVVNGSGPNPDVDSNKDLVARVAYKFARVGAGVSAYHGSELVSTSTVPAGRDFDKDRYGADVQWTTPVPGLTLRAEYITGVTPPSSGTTLTESRDVEGWYAYAVQNVGKRHQFAVRVDEYDPDTDVAGNAVRTLNPSYIFHWDKHSKVMLSYELIETERNDPDDDVFTLRYQFAF